MNIDFDFHPECFLVLPLVALSDIRCDRCDESHGTALCFGWFFWECSFVWESNPHE